MIKRVLYERRGLSLAAMLALCLAPLMASADFTRTNPVTGETENYTWKFVGTDIWNGSQYWQNSDGDTPSGGGVPARTDGGAIWDPILFDNNDPGNTINIHASMSVEGWDLCMGLYNGANITLNNLQKLQGDKATWFTVDETSQLIIATMASDKLEGSDPLSLYSAREGGITWTPTVANAAIGTGTQRPIHYYLAGNGTVAYSGGISLSSDQVIKCADVTLSETADSTMLRYKTLVSFASSSTSTFSADATIKVKNANGSALKEVNLDSVTATTPTLTASGNVGDCELVQTSTGVVLYYVDYATDYTPSININFCHGNAPLTTAADVGYGDYAVPGTSWNNMVSAGGNNGTFTTPLSTIYGIDSTGAQKEISGASVAVSGTRGSWSCSSLAAASDLRQGYIDENDGNPTPTITVSGIPYDKYKVVVYTSTDAADTAFGYVTVNGTNYTYVNNELTEGTTTWGASGASNSANAIAEGVNMLVTPTISGGTLTVVGHRMSGARGCIAAIQIVKVEQQVGENDLLIELDGDKTYTFDEAKAYSGTVYVTGEGTLTFDGAASTAETLHIGAAAAVNMVGSSLTPTAVTGNGTVVYDGEVPQTDKGWTDSANWTGTVWIKNKSGITGNSTAGTGVQPNNLGNANSKVKFSGVSGWLEAPITYTPEIVLENDAYDYALKLTNGNSPDNKNNNENRCTVIKKLSGSGKVTCGETSNAWPTLKVYDASAYTGDIDCGSSGTCLVVVFAAENETLPDTLYALFNGVPRSIYISENGSATVASGATWTAKSGITVNGTLYANGTLASSAASAVKGSGMVVFTGRAPTPTGDAWWKNAAWTGTVWIKSHAIAALDTNLYGNEGSTLKFTDVTGYFAQNHVNTVPIELENNGSTAAFNYNNGWGGELLTFSELKGTGTLQTSSAGDGGTIWVKKWDAFTGVMNLGKKQVVMGGSEPAHGNVNRGGKLVIAEGAVVTNLNATTSWTAGGGIEVNGTFAATDRTAWVDGTAMTINSTGILNMYGSGVNDTGRSFANVTGTGTIWYSQTTTADDKWSALPSSAARMFANTLSVSNDNVNAGVIITMNGASDVVTTNANISGTGYFRSDWGEGAYRGFLALQSKNTTWSGTFGSNSRIKKFIVAGVDGATDRTLTLAGTQSSTIPLTVESLGSVNITGTWVGDTTVSGTFGGTGTLTGNLTFSDGATFMATNTPLTVSGDIKVPATGVVTVDVSHVTFDADTITILKSSDGSDYSVKFMLIGYVPEEYVLKEQFGALVLTKSSGGDIPEPAGNQVRFWVDNDIANADVNVYTNGVLLALEGEYSGCNIYFPNGNADVTIVYSAQEGHVIVGQTRYSVEQVTDDLEFPRVGKDIVDMTVKSVDELTEVAFVTDSKGFNTLYKTLNGAFEAVKSNETVTLIRDAELTNTVTLTNPVVVAGYNCKMGGPLTLGSGSSLTMKEGVAITNAIAVTDYKVTVTYPTALAEAPTVTPPEGYGEVTTENEDGTSTISFKKHEEPEPPTPSSGYTAWQEENSIDGDWDAETYGIANVFRYVFDKPSETFQLITNITFNADSHAVIWTPQMVNDTDSAEFAIYVVPSADLVFDESDENDKVQLSDTGATEIVEDLQEARFFRLKAEKKSQE